MRHTRTSRPYKITRWEEQPEVALKAVYPQSMRLADGTIYLFCCAGHGQKPWTLRMSTDECKTWSKPQRIIEMRLDPPDRMAAAYASIFPGPDGKTIHCFWNHKDDNAALVNSGRLEEHPWRPLKYKGLLESVYRYNIYYMRRKPDGIWVNANGKAVSLPVSKAEADAKCLVYDSGDEFARPHRLAVDKDNRPYIMFRVGVSDWKNGQQIIIVPTQDKYAFVVNGKWQVTDNIPAHLPAEVCALLLNKGFPARGQRDYGLWSISYWFPKEGGAELFLYNDKDGYALRKGGPVLCK